MFLDASAIVAILSREPEADGLSDRLETRTTRGATSPSALYEAALALMRTSGRTPQDVLSVLEEFVRRTRIDVVPIDLSMMVRAVSAYQTYGKTSGHPARLNMGDCFAYAAARELGVPLLYKGDDFVHTDLG